jgi:putative cell wall-binding protein/peptidoglycan/xylan/chitin deacetylase (PgdA/CDA1 family)
VVAAVAVIAWIALATIHLPPPLTPSAPEAAAAGDPNFEVVRLAGSDRYATAAQVSRRFFPSGAPIAFVTTGLNFPDALAAGPAAAHLGGPVLFTRPGSLPGTTSAELIRIGPDRIVVVGGGTAVSTTVLAQLNAIAPTARIAGVDRYATSAQVSAHAFPTGAPVAYVASGVTFPDALAGGAAAGTQGGPMLLTAPTDLPTSVAAELRRLAPGRIMVLGGTGAVSNAVASELATIATVERIAGADRYQTAVAVSQRVFGPDRPAAFLVTGLDFPDALAAVAPAGRIHGPIFLVTGDSLRAGTGAELTRLTPTVAYLIGGTSVVGVGVAKEAQRLLGLCWSGAKPPAGVQQVISSVPGATKQIALTFDLGGRTDPALDIVRFLTDNQVCTTFFATGYTANAPEGRPVMAAMGAHPELFEIGNHTYHHCDLVNGGGGSPTSAPCLVAMTSTFIRNEITTTRPVIAATSGLDDRPYWRPPYGSHNAFVRDNVAAAGATKTIVWSRDTIDWDPGTTVSQIVSRATSPLPPDGTIVLFHLGGYNTLSALPQVIATLRANGYTLTTVSDMLS